MEYELMYLIGDKEKENLGAIKKDIEGIVTTAGAKLEGSSIEFERKFAFEIQHQWHGTYVVQRFTLGDKDAREEGLGDDELPTDTVGEITRQLNLSKPVLRYIIVNAEELPPLDEFVANMSKSAKEGKKILKEKGEKIDGKLEKVLKI